MTKKPLYPISFKEPPDAPLNFYQWILRLSSNTLTIYGYGLVAVLLCYHQSLKCYFLADDFMHLNYLKQVFNGNFGLLLQNFWSTWLQTQGTSFYRPFISLTMALDYWVWKYSAWGYHLTNLLFYFLCAMGIYLIANEMNNKKFRGTFPLIACTLFIVFPLHTEVASWVIARVDSVCACFYFFSFYFFLKHINEDKTKIKSKSGRHASLYSFAFFILSLLSKEMAAVLPLTLVSYLFFFPIRKNCRFKTWLRDVFNQTYIYWILLAAYLVVRTLALKTLIGGYQGSLADSNFQDFLNRFIFNGGFEFFFFPFNHEVLQGWKRLANLTGILYLVSGACFLICTTLFRKTIKPSYKIVLFSFSWFVIALLPAITVWNLTSNLTGARFAFLASAPFCLALAAMISVPVDLLYRNKKIWNKIPNIQRISLQASVVVLFLAWTGLNFFATQENNLAWLRASNEVLSLKTALEEESRKIGFKKDLALLNIPNRYAGAHMLYNGSMLYILLQPPLVDPSLNLSERVHTFESALFGPSDLLNYSRLEKMSTQKDRFNIYYWNRSQKQLLPVYVNSSSDIRPDFILKKPFELTPGKIVGSPIIDIKCGDYKFAQLFVKNPSDAKLALTWNSPTNTKIDLENAVVANFSEKTKSYIFPLSEHKSWLLSKIVHRLFVVIASGNQPVTIEELRLLSGNNLIAKVNLHDIQNGYLGPDGVFYISGKNSDIKVDYDVQLIDKAKKACLEVSRPNSWFEHKSKSFRDNSLCKDALVSRKLPLLSGSATIKADELKGPGYYEVRIAALDQNDEIAGYFSDPLVFQISK